MSFLDRFRKRTEDEASRIARLSKTGRMVDGKIIDAVSDNDGRIIPCAPEREAIEEAVLGDP